jgi:hypothetical protein
MTRDERTWLINSGKIFIREQYFLGRWRIMRLTPEGGYTQHLFDILPDKESAVKRCMDLVENEPEKYVYY